MRLPIWPMPMLFVTGLALVLGGTFAGATPVYVAGIAAWFALILCAVLSTD